MERRISDFLDFEQIYSTGVVETTPNLRSKPIVSHRASFDRTHTVNLASSATPLQTRVAPSNTTTPGQSMVIKKSGASILARRTKKPLSLIFAACWLTRVVSPNRRRRRPPDNLFFNCLAIYLIIVHSLNRYFFLAILPDTNKTWNTKTFHSSS